MMSENEKESLVEDIKKELYLDNKDKGDQEASEQDLKGENDTIE